MGRIHLGGKFEKLWKILEGLYYRHDPLTSRVEMLAFSQGLSEDTVQLRAVTVLMEQKGGG